MLLRTRVMYAWNLTWIAMCESEQSHLTFAALFAKMSLQGTRVLHAQRRLPAETSCSAAL